MLKSGINSDKITRKEKQYLKNVASLSVSNFGATSLVVTVNNVPETVPPFDTVNNYAPKFCIDGDGTYCDIDITVDFVGGVGNAVMRYRKILDKKCD